LRKLMEFVAITYPRHILFRRVNLLTDKERERCNKLWARIFRDIEKIDEIIAERAEKANDPWK